MSKCPLNCIVLWGYSMTKFDVRISFFHNCVQNVIMLLCVFVDLFISKSYVFFVCYVYIVNTVQIMV